MKNSISTFLLFTCLIVILTMLPDKVIFAQSDSETVSKYLDTLVLTPEEREFLEEFYENRGLPSMKIVGGEDTDIEDVPWQVALTTSGGAQFCGGTVIDEEWVVTAAHCLGSFTPRIRAGVTDRRSTAGQDRIVSQVIPHPQYVNVGQGYDIALLKL